MPLRLLRPGGLQRAFGEASAVGWGSVAGALVAPLAEVRLPLAPMDPVVGSVRQRGRSGVVPVVAHPVLERLAGELAAAAPGGWRPDEASIVVYDRAGGISPHRDNERYEGFVVTITLAGTAPVDVVADRAGTAVLASLRCRPGDLLVLRGAPGERPLHRVGPPADGSRTVLVLRRNEAGAGVGWR